MNGPDEMASSALRWVFELFDDWASGPIIGMKMGTNGCIRLRVKLTAGSRRKRS